MTKRRTLQILAGAGRVALVLAAVLVLAWATAQPADAQASRTRPEGSSASSGSSSSGSASSGRTAVSGSPAGRTRPSGSSGGTTVVDNDRRSRRFGRPGHSGFHYPYSWSYYHWYPYRYSWWLGYWGWYGWWDYYPYSGYGPGPYPYHGAYYARDGGPGMGGLDLDLKPGDTQIYLDGQYIGTADNFDGWPRYLWLEPGDYHFIFWHQGRRPIVREYKILPEVVIDVTDRLEPGEATPVEELFPTPTERRDARIQRNLEMRQRVEEESAASWRERSARVRRSTADEEWEEGEAAGESFASLRLRVEPADASVYLDGRFLGTADDLARLSRGLTVDAGEHTLSVVRPGYEAEEVDFDAESGEEISLEVTLGREG